MINLKLPIEIKVKIFQELSKENLYQCMFVCKSWYTDVSKNFYYEVELFKSQKVFLKDIKLIRIDGHYIGDFVRELIFTDPIYRSKLEYHYNKNEFLDLISNLSNLHRICFKENISRKIVKKYITYLMDVPKHQLKGIQEVYMTYIHNINPEIKNYYILINYRFKDTITNLTLEYFNSEFFNLNYKNVLQFLSEFKNLKNLKIINKIYEGIPGGIWLSSILNSCIDLNFLELYNENNYSELNKITEYNNIVKHKNLKYFKLDTLKMKQQDLEYILKHIPSNLIEFEIKLRDTSFAYMFTEANENFIKLFAKYLKSMKKLIIETSITSNTVQEQGTDIIENSRFYKKRKLFWNFLKFLCDKPIDCKIYINCNYHIVEKLYLLQQEKTLEIYVSLFNNQIINPWNQYLDFSIIKTIQINSRESSYPIYVIINALKELLNIKEQHQQKLSIYIKRGKEQLFLGFLKTNDPIFYNNLYIEIKKKNEDSTIKYSYFKHVKINNQLLQHISFLFPNIEKIIFEECKIEKEQQSNIYLIDLTGFTYIHQFIFDFNRILGKSKVLLIQLIDINKEIPNYYYYHKRLRNMCISLDNLDKLYKSTLTLKIQYVQIKHIILIKNGFKISIK